MFGSIFNNAGAAAPTTPVKTISLFGNSSNTGGGLFNQQGGTTLFGNNNNNPTGGLFSNNNQSNNSLFSNIPNTTSNNLFSTTSNGNNTFPFGNSTNNGNSFFQNNNNNATQSKNCSVGYQFKGNNILEKNTNSTFMSIFSLPEFNHASNEEMRLADYEQRMTGKLKNL